MATLDPVTQERTGFFSFEIMSPGHFVKMKDATPNPIDIYPYQKDVFDVCYP